MFDSWRKMEWMVVDCLTGESRLVEQLPFEIGSGEGVDLKLNGQGVAERHCAINQVKDHGLCLCAAGAKWGNGPRTWIARNGLYATLPTIKWTAPCRWRP